MFRFRYSSREFVYAQSAVYVRSSGIYVTSIGSDVFTFAVNKRENRLSIKRKKFRYLLSVLRVYEQRLRVRLRAKIKRLGRE